MEIFEPYGFIYITTNLVNGKRYIGQKKFDSKYRWKSYLGSGYYFSKALNKYGKENFIRNIVDIGYSPEELDQKEHKWIENYNAVNSEDYYNATEGGNTGSHLIKHNSITCICIDNGMLFNSLEEAALWSGYSTKKIKQSFKMIHTYYDYQNEDYIFRLITEKNQNKSICRICAKNYKDQNYRNMCYKCDEQISLKRCTDCKVILDSTNNAQKRCKSCSKERTRIVKKINRRNQRNKFELTKQEIKELVEKEWKIEKKKIEEINKSVTLNKNKKNQKRKIYKKHTEKIINLNEFKQNILKLYIDERMSVSNIITKLHIKGLTNKKLNESLLEWGVSRPKNYKINDKFKFYHAIYKDNELLEVFEFKYQSRDWIVVNGYSNTNNFTIPQFNYFIDKNREYNGLSIRSIDEKIYIENSAFRFNYENTIKSTFSECH